MSKDFGKDDNNGKEAATWKNREKDWYNAERRFIFATKTRKERDVWLKHINKNACMASNKQIMEAKIQEKSSTSKSKSGANSGLLSPLTEISITDQSKTTSPVPEKNNEATQDNTAPILNAMFGGNATNLRPRNESNSIKLMNAKILSMVSKNTQEAVKETKSSAIVRKRTVRSATSFSSVGAPAKKKPAAPSK